ncbi:MAG TPA: TetR/AcrR family transcriptional regulator [Acidimicrobiales bacterium]|nr:TetR/AcrR family transcriptional regulator [Acidimicrobiales bacterium]
MARSETPARRIGAADSRTRAQLLDAAEALLLEEGYAAVTSRRIGGKAGLKPQLVHYYFRTMDDLFVEVFRRRAEQNLAHFDEGVAGAPTLRRIWDLTADIGSATFLIEFVALANHRKAIRAEIKRYAERFRAAQLAALETALDGAGIPEDEVPPIVALVLMTGVSQIMGIERSLGVKAGHDDTVAFVEALLDRAGNDVLPD